MPDEPQPPSSADPPKRDANGQLLPGGPSLNPGGVPKWVGPVRRELEACCVSGARLLADVIAGTAKDTHVTSEGEEVAIDCRMKDRLAAIKLAFEFTIPKPKDPGDPTDAAARTALAERILARLAGLDS